MQQSAEEVGADPPSMAAPDRASQCPPCVRRSLYSPGPALSLMMICYSRASFSLVPGFLEIHKTPSVQSVDYRCTPFFIGPGPSLMIHSPTQRVPFASIQNSLTTRSEHHTVTPCKNEVSVSTLYRLSSKRCSKWYKLLVWITVVKPVCFSP